MKNHNNRYPIGNLSREEYIAFTSPAAVNVTSSDGAAVIDIDGYIGRDIMREWITGEKSENTSKNIREKLREIDSKRIIVNINSPGGDLNDGLMIYNHLRSKEAEIVTNVLGLSASAATVIAQAGDTRRMAEASFQLIHRVMFGVMGYLNYNSFMNLANDTKVLDDEVIKLYEKRTGMTRNKIAALMDEGEGYGRWAGPEECLELGLVDEVYDPGELDDNTDQLGAANKHKNYAELLGFGDPERGREELAAKSRQETKSAATSARTQREILTTIIENTK